MIKEYSDFQSMKSGLAVPLVKCSTYRENNTTVQCNIRYCSNKIRNWGKNLVTLSL